MPAGRLSSCTTRACALASAFACALVATPARAGERARVTLDYSASEAACPDQASFHNLVGARLGYDPFVAASDDHVRVTLTRDHGRLHGHLDVARAGQASPLARDLSGDAEHCEALATALATTLAIALDPMLAAVPAPPPAPAPPGSPPAAVAAASTPPIVIVEQPPLPAPAAPAPEPAPPLHVGVVAVAGAVASVAEAPTLALGGELGFALRVKALSLEVSGRAESTVAAVHVGSGDRVQATLLSGALAPCVNVGGWSGCAFVRVGGFDGYAPDVAQPSLGTSVWAAAGGRVGYAFALSRAFAIRPTLEAAIPLVRTSLVIDRQVVWTAPPATAGAGLALVVTFF